MLTLQFEFDKTMLAKLVAGEEVYLKIEGPPSPPVSSPTRADFESEPAPERRHTNYSAELNAALAEERAADRAARARPKKIAKPVAQNKKKNPIQLAHLFEAGLLKAGEEFQWNRKQLHKTYSATVTANGRMKVKGVPGEYKYPSALCWEAAETRIDGWLCWKRVSDGKLLREIRDEYPLS